MGHWGWKLAVLVCACWSLVVLSLFLGCCLFCLSLFYIWLVVVFYGFFFDCFGFTCLLLVD